MNETPASSPVSSNPNRALARVRQPLVVALIFGFALISIALFVAHQDARRRAAHLESALADAVKQEAELRQQWIRNSEALDQLKAERADFEQLVGELQRGRDETVLIEVERLVSAAASELQLSGNVAVAINALQSADARLARLQRAPFLALRKSVARDIERLRALPAIDVTGISLRLDEVALGIDAWPMLADPTASLAARSSAPKAAAPTSATSTEADTWSKVRRWLGEEFGDLVRIREVPTPESLLLSTTQQQLVRHQLRLRLLDARQALLARNERLFRSDLQEARTLAQRYFDTKAAAPANALTLLDKLTASAVTLDIPNAALSETLAATQSALTAARGAPRS